MTTEEQIASIKAEISNAGLIFQEWEMLKSPGYMMRIKTPEIDGKVKHVLCPTSPRVLENTEMYLGDISDLWYAAQYHGLDKLVNA